MMKLSHAALTFISGLVWMAVGLFLLPLGLKLILEPSALQQSSLPVLNFLKPYAGGLQEAGTIIVAIALFIGFLKGRHVLGKAARKGVERIKSFPNPTSIGNIYSPKYYILLGGMVALGMCIKIFGLPNDIRGFVDIAVGSALINGAMEYFRMALALRKATSAN